MNMSKIDEGDTLLAEVNAENIVESVQKDFDVPITEEEIDYYIQNHHPCKEQLRLVYTYYGKIFGNVRDCKLLTRRDYIRLMLILKKKLLFDAGMDVTDDRVAATTALAYIISGNLEGQSNTRIIRNEKFKSGLENSYQYKELKEEIYNLLEEIKPEELDSLISLFVNGNYTYCSYEHPELLGQKILYTGAKISEELNFFLRNC